MLELRDIMTANVVTVTPETSLREAAAVLAARHVGGAPVMEGGTVAGVVSASDILSFEASAATAPRALEPRNDGDDEWDELPAWDADEDPPASYFINLWSAADADVTTRIAEPATLERDVLAEHTVAEAMTRPALWLPPTADVSEAAEKMRSAEVHRVLVMDDAKLLGIITTMDLARAVADRRVERRTYVFEQPHGGRDHRGGP